MFWYVTSKITKIGIKLIKSIKLFVLFVKKLLLIFVQFMNFTLQ